MAMMNTTSGRVSRLLRRVAMGAVAVLLAAAMTPALPDWSSSAHAAQNTSASDAKKAPDKLILRSGTVVEGEILEETDSTVRIRVMMSGISAATTYQKSEILEIKRGDAVPAEEEPATSVRADARSSPSPSTRTGAGSAKSDKKDVDPGAAKLYVATLKGRFGVDVSETPLRDLFADVDRTFNDLVDGVGASSGRKIVDPSMRQNHIVVLKVDMFSQPGYGSIFRAKELAPIVMDEITLKGRRVVFWVDHASGGAAFFPWVSPEIYFTEDGVLGGIGDLDEFTSGDHMVDEKLIGAFLGAAEGFAIKGGYGEHLPAMRAMIRRQNWLAVRFEGGRPVYLTRLPTAADGEGWQILSDSGEGDYKDTSTTSGNDTFVLEAEWATKLGIARGTADTIDDLAFALGVHRSYTELDNIRGPKVFEDWTRRIDDAIALVNPNELPGVPVGRLWREFAEIQVGGNYQERRRDRGRKLNILQQIRAMATRFAEVFDTDGAWRAQLDVMIAQLRLEAEQDARANRAGGN